MNLTELIDWYYLRPIEGRESDCLIWIIKKITLETSIRWGFFSECWRKGQNLFLLNTISGILIDYWGGTNAFSSSVYRKSKLMNLFFFTPTRHSLNAFSVFRTYFKGRSGCWSGGKAVKLLFLTYLLLCDSSIIILYSLYHQILIIIKHLNRLHIHENTSIHMTSQKLELDKY